MADALPFGVGGPAENAVGAPQFVLNALKGLATLPKRAIENSQNAISTGIYDPSVPVEAALLTMGATPLGTGEKTLGAGPVKASLDMSREAQLGRAADQGFDVTKPVYHGTSKDLDFKKFKDSRHGTWTTTDPASASEYALQNDSMGYRLSPGNGYSLEKTNSASRVLPLYAKPLEKPYVGDVPDSLRTADNYKKAQSDWFDSLKRQGFDGVDMGNGVRVDFNNANLRSQYAPFDPSNAGKSKILGVGPTDSTMMILNFLKGNADGRS